MANLKMEKLQEEFDKTFNECETAFGQITEILIMGLVLLICSIFIIETYPISPEFFKFLTQLETIITCFFFIEYLLRWWAKKFSIKHLFTPMAITDFLAILPLFLSSSHWQFIRILRLFRILRIFRLFKHQRVFFRHVTDYHIEIIKVFSILFCMVFIWSGLLYDFEGKQHPDNIETFFDALYFTIVTISTVGYGDIAPMSAEGKTITLLMIISGVTIIPWHLSNLAKSIVLAASKQNVMCNKCGLLYHDPDAVYCKSCGNIIFQEYSGPTIP